MTMHICHASLTTTGKKRGKQKFRNADAAAKARKAEADWKELQKRWGVEAEDKKRNRAMTAPTLSKSYEIPAGRNTTAHIPSKDTGVGVAARAEDKVYTGTNMIGISLEHKSRLVPVFSKEQAADIAKMRR